MPLETQFNPVPGVPSKGIDVARIEKELAAMWANASDGENGTRSGVIRACALNLIVYTTPRDDRQSLEDLLSQVNEQHPGRTLILVADRETKEPRLEAYLSTRCRLLGATGKQICGEQITIEASGPIVQTAATAVAPLLVPDVPVYLWWKDIPHYEDKLFDRLAQMADRIVINSAAFDHPYDDLLRLSQMISDSSRPVRVSDLNWGELTSWRTLLASFWDVPDYRPLLDKIDRVEIKYRPPADSPKKIATKALLLASWFSSRLGWKVVGDRVRPIEGAIECDFSSGDHDITFSLIADMTTELNDGKISLVALSATKEAAEFSVALRAGATKLETEARFDAAHSVGRVLSYQMRSEAERLSRELAFLTHDAIYEESVAQAAQLVGAIINYERN
ncbi:MAG TPA: glucose-6-phosphate dehydrogenase assembly protein OpcA [Pyrinomonadaceae bacterium]|nr:glucose-6-phosphate dehydrogenase assembly protein OpcA [Pyrinomonadaceae bacterium]